VLESQWIIYSYTMEKWYELIQLMHESESTNPWCHTVSKLKNDSSIQTSTSSVPIQKYKKRPWWTGPRRPGWQNATVDDHQEVKDHVPCRSIGPIVFAFSNLPNQSWASIQPVHVPYIIPSFGAEILQTYSAVCGQSKDRKYRTTSLIKPPCLQAQLREVSGHEWNPCYIIHIALIHEFEKKSWHEP